MEMIYSCKLRVYNSVISTYRHLTYIRPVASLPILSIIRPCELQNDLGKVSREKFWQFQILLVWVVCWISSSITFLSRTIPEQRKSIGKNGKPVSKYSFVNGPFQIETVTGQQVQKSSCVKMKKGPKMIFPHFSLEVQCGLKMVLRYGPQAAALTTKTIPYLPCRNSH